MKTFRFAISGLMVVFLILFSWQVAQAAQKPPKVQADWTQFHYDPQHTGFNPYEKVLSPANVAGLSQAWQYTTGGPIFSSPAVANGVVYVGTYNSFLYALDARTGAFKWSYLTGGEVRSSPAVVNGVVYFGSYDSKLYAFSLAP